METLPFEVQAQLHSWARPKGPSKSDRPLAPYTCFLRVLDFPPTGELGLCVAEANDTVETKVALDSLPIHEPGVTRLYFEELLDYESFYLHLGTQLGARFGSVDFPFRFAQEASADNNLRSLISSSGQSSAWLKIQNFCSPPPKRFGSRGHVEMVSSWQSIVLDEDRTLILISIQSTADRRMGGGSELRDTLVQFFNATCQSLLSSYHGLDRGALSASGNSNSNLDRLLFLHYIRLHLVQINSFSTKLNVDYASNRQLRVDPKRITLTPSVLADIMKDALFCERIREISSTMTELASSEIDLLSEILEDVYTKTAAFRRLRAEIQVLCSAQNRLAARLVDRLESQLKFLALSRDINASASVQLLTLLASIFLPMSLASGILSMQTRFVNLRYLLYDFCGVVSIIGTLIIAVYLTLKLMTRVMDQRARTNARSKYNYSWFKSHGNEPAVIEPWHLFILVLTPWALIFTSFMVGMIKNVSLGLQILGFGLVACLVFLVLAIVQWSRNYVRIPDVDPPVPEGPFST